MEKLANVSLFCSSDLSGALRGSRIVIGKTTLAFFVLLTSSLREKESVIHLHGLSGNRADPFATGLQAVQQWPLVWCTKRKHLICCSPSAAKQGGREGGGRDGKGREKLEERRVVGDEAESAVICSPCHSLRWRGGEHRLCLALHAFLHWNWRFYKINTRVLGCVTDIEWQILGFVWILLGRGGAFNVQLLHINFMQCIRLDSADADCCSLQPSDFRLFHAHSITQ